MKLKIDQKIKNGTVWRFMMKRLKLTFEHDKWVGLTSFSGVWAASTIAALITVYGSPSGIGTYIELPLVYFLNSAAIGIASLIIAMILSLLMVPLPRFLIGGAIYTATVCYYVLYHSKLGTVMSATITAVYVLLAVIAGLFIAVLLNRTISSRIKGFSISLAVVFVGAFIIVVQFHGTAIHYPTDVRSVQPLSAPSPADKGPYPVHYFTYGSGKDQHRASFGDEVSLVSKTVDASSYTEKWPWERELFWGFNITELPLNGRVWVPEGEGRFPLVLIVHGNSTMEYFSDGGYDYLGELFASRGIVAVSVDENFLNYSHWSGVPKNDMLVRAWILIKHLQQIQQFSEAAGNPFYAKVDWDNVGLIGHSRGGQAIVMAANYENWFKDDDTLFEMNPPKVKALAALAPTDNKVDADGSYRLKDVYYLVLQGAMDADVSNFYGARQYNRTTFSPGSHRFKASLYIAGANHAHFNTDWGTLDLSVPGGLFLTGNGKMKEEHQRRLAQVYLSAFFESALLENDQYRALFQDYRNGLHWLPETRYFSRYEDGQFHAFTRFDASSDSPEQPGKLSAYGEGVDLTIEKAKHRRGSSIGTKGLVVSWELEGSYTLELPVQTVETSDWFVFSMANLEHETAISLKGKPFAFIDLEFEQANGEKVRVSLADYLPMYRSIETTFTWLPELEQRMKKGAYQNAAEATLQTFRIPLDDIHDNEEASPLTKVTFHFTNGPGKVMLDDIGWTSNHKEEAAQ